MKVLDLEIRIKNEELFPNSNYIVPCLYIGVDRYPIFTNVLDILDKLSKITTEEELDELIFELLSYSISPYTVINEHGSIIIVPGIHYFEFDENGEAELPEDLSIYGDDFEYPPKELRPLLQLPLKEMEFTHVKLEINVCKR